MQEKYYYGIVIINYDNYYAWLIYRRIWLISACAYISTARKVGLIIQGALNKQVQLSGCGLICYCLASGA